MRNRIVDELSPANVQVSWTTGASGRPARVTVTVSGTSAGPMLRALLLTRRPASTVDYRG
jgi:hypothetical protein